METLKTRSGDVRPVGHRNYEQMENGGGGGGRVVSRAGKAADLGAWRFPHALWWRRSAVPVDRWTSKTSSAISSAAGVPRDVRRLSGDAAEVKSGTSRTVRVPETRTVDPRRGWRGAPARDVRWTFPRASRTASGCACPGRARGSGPGRAQAVGSLHRRGRCGGPAFAEGADLVPR